MSTQSTFTPSIGLDPGNQLAAAAVVESGSVPIPIRIHGDLAMPNAVMVDGGTTLVGKKAINRGYRNPSGLVCDTKRQIGNPDHKVTSCGLTVGQCLQACLAELLESVKKGSQVLTKAIQDNNFKTVIAVPSTFGEAEKKVYREKAEALGIKDVGFATEPTAAATNIKSLYPERFKDGTRVIIADAGSSTFDLELMEFKDGKFHQVAQGTGVRLGGTDFTGAIYFQFCELLGYEQLAKCFMPGHGFSFDSDDLSLKEKALAIKLREEAEACKIELSNTGTSDRYIELSDEGLKELPMDLESAKRLWEPIIQKMMECLTKFTSDLQDSRRSDLLICVGGCALLPDFKERSALAARIDLVQVLFVADSVNVIANGAAEIAATGCTGDSILNRGIGVKMRRKDTNEEVVKVLAIQGETVPNNGLRIKNSGQFIETENGSAALDVQCFEVHSGVEPYDHNGHLLVSLDNASPIGQRQIRFANLAAGRQQLDMQLFYQNRNPVFSIRPLETDQEPQMFSILDDSKPIENASQASHMIFLADASTSMGKDIQIIAKAIENMGLRLANNQVECSLISFASKAKVLVKHSTNATEIASAAGALKSDGSTNMTAALELVRTIIKPESHNTVFLYTDGFPNSAGNLIHAADKIRKLVNKVVTFGVGDLADHELLKSFVASTPKDHFEGTTEDIPIIFSTVVDMYLLDPPNETQGN
jgi:molecular chaperone DnaK (HSP70)/uncharacterized protein YegL